MVVVLEVVAEKSPQVALTDDVVEHSRRMLPMTRSAKGFWQGYEGR